MGVHDGHRDRMRKRFLENELMDRFGSLSGVFSAPVELLAQVKGVGTQTAVLLRLVSQIAQRARLTDLERELALNTRARVGQYLLELFSHLLRQLRHSGPQPPQRRGPALPGGPGGHPSGQGGAGVYRRAAGGSHHRGGR